jgi:hypothetical protein
MVVNMDKTGFKKIMLPSSPSLRPGQNFYHSNNLADFVSLAAERLNEDLKHCSAKPEK